MDKAPLTQASALASTSQAGTTTLSLDGDWKIVADPKDEGRDAKWFEPAAFPAADSCPIQVPGAVGEVWPRTGLWMDASTIIAWYSRTFPLDFTPQKATRYYLRFGAVKRLSEVWLNGILLGAHEGGEDPFEFDVTTILKPGRPNTVAVRFVAGVMGGIYRHVTIVAQPEVRILDAHARPDTKTGQIHLDVTIENNTSRPAPVEVQARLSEYKSAATLGGQSATVSAEPGQTVVNLILPVKHPHLWDLDDPFLYVINVTTDWNNGNTSPALRDTLSLRTGFRDFRLVDGYFYLNERRIFVASSHGNHYDPISIQGTSRDLTYMSRDLTQLKKSGFNMMRFIVSAAVPELLDQADEMGFLLYAEHETSWLLKDPTKFGNTLNETVRRDRNHPSLVIWGLLNETVEPPIYERAKNWLPSLRALDETRPVVLSSGRWENDFKTASISNTGSKTWDVYLGGEDPENPKPTGPIDRNIGAYRDGAGDMHIYPFYPLTWNFVTEFAQLSHDTHPIFMSELGIGSSYNPIEEERLLKEAGAPDFCYSWDWARPGVEGMKKTWATYGLSGTYPNMEDMMVDSALSAALQRELLFSIVRSNPKVNGYNLTGIQDFFGAGEGVLNNFRGFKPGHLEVLQAGWAPLRWCLFVNPLHAYADQPLRIKVSLANLDILPAGNHPATLSLSGPNGIVWKQSIVASIKKNGPLAYTLFDQDVAIANLKEGAYTLQAALDGKPNATSGSLTFTVTTHASLPKFHGQITVAGVARNIRDFLEAQGASVRDYQPHEKIDHEVLLVGPSFAGNAEDWWALYRRAAGGGHIIFLAGKIFHADSTRNKWLALPEKGDQNADPEWLYHKDVVAKVNHPLLAGLPPRLMTPEVYGPLLLDASFFQNTTLPDDTAAVAIRSTLLDKYRYVDGFMLGTYKFYAGHFTLNAFNAVEAIGTPAADRLLINLLTHSQSKTFSMVPIPVDFDSAMNRFGMS